MVDLYLYLCEVTGAKRGAHGTGGRGRDRITMGCVEGVKRDNIGVRPRVMGPWDRRRSELGELSALQLEFC